ncbi:DNA-binding protein, partial [Sulfolobus sp. A20-N-G8]
MARKSLFKACKNCKALVNPDDSVCPICGSTNFSDDWDGIIIVIDENSEISN